MRKSKSPRPLAEAGQGANKIKHPENESTTATIESQGLRFAISRLDRSKSYLRFSILEGKEILDLLKLHPSPEAAVCIARQEQRVRRTEARLVEVQGSLAALYAALLRLEEASA